MKVIGATTQAKFAFNSQRVSYFHVPELPYYGSLAERRKSLGKAVIPSLATRSCGGSAPTFVVHGPPGTCSARTSFPKRKFARRKKLAECAFCHESFPSQSSRKLLRVQSGTLV